MKPLQRQQHPVASLPPAARPPWGNAESEERCIQLQTAVGMLAAGSFALARSYVETWIFNEGLAGRRVSHDQFFSGTIGPQALRVMGEFLAGGNVAAADFLMEYGCPLAANGANVHTAVIDAASRALQLGQGSSLADRHPLAVSLLWVDAKRQAVERDLPQQLLAGVIDYLDTYFARLAGSPSPAMARNGMMIPQGEHPLLTALLVSGLPAVQRAVQLYSAAPRDVAPPVLKLSVTPQRWWRRWLGFLLKE